MQCSSNRALRRANFDSASLHLSRGLAPYVEREPGKNASTFPQEDSAVPTSIPLRFISVAGYRPMEKQKRPAGRMRALFPKGAPPCQPRFRGFAASSRSRAIALWKSKNELPEECKHSFNDELRRANLDSAALPLHLGRGLSPYGKAKTSSRKNASTLPGARFCFSARLNAITKAPIFPCIIDSMFLLV